jgi:alpha-D-ribose 1-methylphosphonate 5-triphosphate diphosphatase PhnM
MAAKKLWTKEKTVELICLYESSPEIWDTQHIDYVREKRSMCWESMAEGMNTRVAEVQRKIHNLRNQVITLSRTVLHV